MTFKAVIFDIGGVCVGSPMAGIRLYEERYGLPTNYINVAITQQGEQGAFQKLERGEIKLHDFYIAFGDQLSNPSSKQHYLNYLEKTGKPAPSFIPDVVINGKDLFTTMMKETQRLDQKVFTAIRKLRESGQFRVAALTNNFELPEDDLKETEELGGKVPETLKKMFELFIESRLVGLRQVLYYERKPDPKFYLHACKLLNVNPTECIFLDDIGMNLSSAKKLGMATIQVKIGKSEEAIQQLEALVGLDLHSKEQKL
ncbi:epoxide hydrolase [Phycomyces blakesleeanus]|uniref:Epoxide hydrolase n=1 Tax=Phycomyces blakesleeanus TaxID=4837 RepID=A0ABR3BI16_PHYBL